MEEKVSFLMYLDYEEHFKIMTDEQIGQLMRAIMEYEKTKKIPELEGMVKMAFSFIKAQLDRDREKWKTEKNKRSTAGKKGMAKRWNNSEHKETVEEALIGDNKDNNVINVNNKNNSVITNDNKNNSVINVITRHNTV